MLTNMLTSAYPSIGLTYQFLLLTFSIAQVACERSFSCLKLMKSRFHRSICQDKLKNIMLMACEYNIILTIDNELIIYLVSNQVQPTPNICFGVFT